MEGIFVLLIVGMHALADLVGGGARRDEGRLQARGPGLQRQHDFGDVAGDDDIDLVLIDRALEGANGIGGGGVVVVGDDFDLAAIDAALGVDLIGGHLRGLRDRRTGDRLCFSDHADLDGISSKSRAGSCDEAEGCSAKEPAQGPEYRRSGFHRGFSPLVNYSNCLVTHWHGTRVLSKRNRAATRGKGPQLKSIIGRWAGALRPDLQPSMIATARVQPADARSIFTGKHDTMKPVGGSCSRLCSFSIWQ